MGVCPLSGIACPGEHECAPAKYSALKDEHGNESVRCPISMATDSLSLLAYSMEPFVRSMIGTMKQLPKDPTPLDRDEFIRTVVKPEGRE